tara:strand:+ start:571 stop:795 length:225 start_codon:yes stop_codon:yes gene_type:complete
MDGENEKEGKVCYVRIEPAENGWIVSYSEKKDKPGAGMYEPMMEKTEKLVFMSDKTDEAFETFKKMKIEESKED